MKKLLLLVFALCSTAIYAQVMTVTVPQDQFAVCPTDVVDVTAVRSTPANNSIAFNGSSQRFDIPASPATNFGMASFSVEFWVNLNSSSGITYLATNRNALGQGWAIYVDNAGRVGFGVRDAIGGFDVVTGTISSINDASWHHVAVTWDRGSTEATIYVDGGFEISKNMAVGDVGTTSPITLGYGVSPFSGAAVYVNGDFDEFRMWSGVRSSGDIQTYKSTHLNPSSFPDLVCNFDFNEVVATDGWYDCAGSITVNSGGNSPTINANAGPTMTFNFAYTWDALVSGAQQAGANYQGTFSATDTLLVSTGYCKYETMDTVFVTALDCDTLTDPRDVAAVFAPTAFTPNGDTKNDYYIVKANAITYFEMQVYNRLGNILFYSKDINTGWDGTFEDKRAHEGVYVAKILYRDVDGVEFVKYQQFSLMR
jgi:gliding motility-associated-like protein